MGRKNFGRHTNGVSITKLNKGSLRRAAALQKCTSTDIVSVFKEHGGVCPAKNLSRRGTSPCEEEEVRKARRKKSRRRVDTVHIRYIRGMCST